MSQTDTEDSSDTANDSTKLEPDDKNAIEEDEEATFKIVSWNINGMRTFNMEEILSKQLKDASIVLVQETKLASNLTFKLSLYILLVLFGKRGNYLIMCNFFFACRKAA